MRERPPRPGPAEAGGAPTDGQPDGQPERLLMSFRWGLVPLWSKDAKAGSRLFNVRSETVATRASFREAFKERRIIVPADGFYEWRKTKTGAKQPHYFTRADGAPMAFAGLAERWRPKDAPKDTSYLRSCTVITAPVGADMEGIHDRMPVILDPATFDLWLDPTNEDSEELRALLRPPPAAPWCTTRSGRESVTCGTTIRRSSSPCEGRVGRPGARSHQSAGAEEDRGRGAHVRGRHVKEER